MRELELDGRLGYVFCDLRGLVDLVPERQYLVAVVLELVLRLHLRENVELSLSKYQVDVVLQVVDVPVLRLDRHLPLHITLVEDARREQLTNVIICIIV